MMPTIHRKPSSPSATSWEISDERAAHPPGVVFMAHLAFPKRRNDYLQLAQELFEGDLGVDALEVINLLLKGRYVRDVAKRLEALAKFATNQAAVRAHERVSEDDLTELLWKGGPEIRPSTSGALQKRAEWEVTAFHDYVRREVRAMWEEIEERRWWDEFHARPIPVLEPNDDEELEYLDRDDPRPTACTGYDWSKPSPEEVREELRESKVGNAQWRIAVADMEGRKPAKDDLAIVRRADKGLEPETDTEANQRRKKKDEDKLWLEVWTHLGGRCASCGERGGPVVVHHVGGGDGRGDRHRKGQGGTGTLRGIRQRVWKGRIVTDFQLLCVGCHEKLHYGDKPRGPGRRLQARMPPV
jgi:hypothetical protein